MEVDHWKNRQGGGIRDRKRHGLQRTIFTQKHQAHVLGFLILMFLFSLLAMAYYVCLISLQHNPYHPTKTVSIHSTMSLKLKFYFSHKYRLSKVISVHPNKIARSTTV